MKHEDSGSWHALETAWQDDHRRANPRQSALIARLGRRRQWIDWTVRVSELLVILVFGGLALHWLWSGSSAQRVAAVFVLTVLTVVSILRRHAWFGGRAVPTDAPTHFVQALLDRNADGHRAIRLGNRLLAVQILFFVVWLPWSADPPNLIGSYTFLALWSAGFFLSLRAAQRYLQREQRKLETLRDELKDD